MIKRRTHTQLLVYRAIHRVIDIKMDTIFVIYRGKQTVADIEKTQTVADRRKDTHIFRVKKNSS